MTQLRQLTIETALEGLSKKEFSSCELVQAHNDAIEKYSDINAFCVQTKDIALEQARQSDEKRKRQEETGLIEGLPIAVKDL